VPAVAVTPVLARLLPQFAERYPQVEVDVSVENRDVDFAAEGLDAGIRLVEAVDRDTSHVRLSGPTRIVVAGAPSYLKRRGVPSQPGDLLKHDCLCVRFGSKGEPWAWRFDRGKKTWRVPVRGRVTSNDGALARSLALAGAGLLYTFEPAIADELGRGRLRVVLEQYAPSVPGLYLCFPSRARLSPALRAFVDVAREVAREVTRKGRKS
jgi:DNA-binding transcriptional LysR family regulator